MSKNQTDNRHYNEQQGGEMPKRVTYQSDAQPGSLVFAPSIEAVAEQNLDVTPPESVQRFAVATTTTGGCSELGAAGL